MLFSCGSAQLCVDSPREALQDVSTVVKEVINAQHLFQTLTLDY